MSALRCRTCDAAIERTEVRGVSWVGVCARCADRTQLRCPACRSLLAARGAGGMCEHHGGWVLNEGRLEAGEPPERVSVAASVAASAAIPRERLGLDVETVMSRTEGGYRGTAADESRELVHRKERSESVTTDALTLARGTIGIVGSIVALGALLMLASGNLALICVGLGGLGITLAGLGWFWKVVERQYGRTERRIVETRLRVSPARIERRGGDRRWSTIADMTELRRVRRVRGEDERYRVELETTDRKRVVVADDLTKDESVEIEAVVNETAARRKRP